MEENRRLVVHENPRGMGAEAFRVLRTNLRFIVPDGELKALLVTSPGPQDGKSMISSNLGIAYAQSGQRVVLVGCDLRKPVLHKIFSCPNSPGLTRYLTGQTPWEEAIIHSGVNGLDLIPAGPIPPNPSELLQSDVMGELLDILREEYDVVILDGAPILAVTDSGVLASQVDGTLLVIRAYEVPRDVAIQAKIALEQAQARLLGVVFNAVRFHEHKHYNYYYYYESEKLGNVP